MVHIIDVRNKLSNLFNEIQHKRLHSIIVSFYIHARIMDFTAVSNNCHINSDES
jgi:hypothetical protein